MGFDIDRAGELALALLYLTLHDEVRAWKSLDWGVMDHLYEEGLIGNPRNAAKSVVFSEEGLTRAKAAFLRLLAAPPVTPAQPAPPRQAPPAGRGPHLSEFQEREARKLLAPLCEVPDDAHVRSQVRKGIRVDGTTIVLFESRPRVDHPAEWMEHPVAKFRYVKSRHVWLLHCMFSDLAWHRYEPLPEAASLAELVDEVRRDPTCIFWG